MNEPIFLTEVGRRELQAELLDLVEDKQPHLAALLEEARRENTEREEDTLLAQGREELARVEQRIRELERLLRNAVSVSPHPAANIGLGTLVRVRDESGEESQYVIVTPMEAQPTSGRISDQSPVGKALMGHMAGETIVVHTPNGDEKMEIVAVA